MKINQHDCFWTSYNTKILKTSRGFSSKLKPYNSVNLAIGRACLYEHVCACQLYFKKPSEDQNIDNLCADKSADRLGVSATITFL